MQDIYQSSAMRLSVNMKHFLRVGQADMDHHSCADTWWPVHLYTLQDIVLADQRIVALP